MHFGIINRSGNVLEWFEDEAEARAALAEMASADVDLLRINDDGGVAPEPIANVSLVTFGTQISGVALSGVVLSANSADSRALDRERAIPYQQIETPA